jgi:hypothetical protein
MDKRKRKGRREGDGRHTEKKKREREGKKRMGAPAPLCSSFCIGYYAIYVYFSPFISEKPPPRGCRHCWPNHVKYCVYCRVFSPSSLCLVGLSHSIGLPSCPNSLLKRFRTYPFATRVFFLRYNWRRLWEPIQRVSV